MENISTISTRFFLLGLVEMEKEKYLCIILSFGIYLITMLLSIVILYNVCIEANLHEPMYLFICNLLFNGMFGSTSLFPKIIIDLLSGSKIISVAGCFIQSFCMHTFASVEVFTFTIMAQDRYLAIGEPLRYPTLMTNGKALNYIGIIWIIAIILVLIPVIMTMKLPLCGKNINNVFCDNMSLVNLACGDSSLNNIFGAIETFIVYMVALMIIIYCYIRTFLICLKLSKDAHQKAVSTLVSHLIAFSCFTVATLFIVLRYRLNSGSIPMFVHILLSCMGIVTTTIVNPFIYGIRTEALRVKILQNLLKIYAR
ncbi:olfactory receptor 4B13-like [Pelobates fuscus]|uniref:olfactory receptor 4B13-like n=1 Tax=Pelobates fuscus TaxID=191477 RepID=UPI002FE4B329